MSQPLVKVDNLQYVYPDGTPALREISLQVHSGETVAIVGANGAGKSTLLLHLNGYLIPVKGQVTIGDLLLTKKTLSVIRRSVGMVFQDPDDQLFMTSVFDDVAFGPFNLGLSPAEVQERVTAALQQVTALHLQERPPYKLSTGEKRRVAIASVLAMSPDVLVMDEPTTGLDPQSRRMLIDLLGGLPQTKIIATHDLDLVLDLCQRTIVVHQGRIMVDGATSEVFSQAELLQRCQLELPLRLQGCPICSAQPSA